MSKPGYYLKRIGQRGKIEIWLVDGSQIRRDLDEEFTNFGQHFRFKCIPENEFWIDKEAVPDERRFFIDHLLEEWQLMKKGMSFKDASDAANIKERTERNKAGDFKKFFDEKIKEKIHCRLLKKDKAGISIWLVDGRLIRSTLDIEFTEGGHDLVYDFVPPHEVWIDNDLSAEERPYIILHETYERSLMEEGLPYRQAHRKASRLEWQSRQDPKVLEKNFPK